MSGFVTAILLSAGKSTRMGYPKALLDWQGIPLIRYQVESLIKGGVSQVIVVLGHDHKEISKYVTDSQAELIINERYDKGKITSIHKGISVVSDESSDIMILSVDQPRDYKIIRDLIKSHSASKSLISIPSNGVKSGHPIMFSVVLKGKLFEISESNKGLKALIDEYRAKINYVNFKNKTIFLDMNTDEEYKLAKKIFR